MAVNPLTEELKKLRESSKYAVAHGDSYVLDEFKNYMHIERNVEVLMKNIIKKSSTVKKSQLILLCGNVGDGKSHILSRLHKETPSELSQFIIHNDATESHNPNESSTETLYKLLNGFRDVHIESSSEKIILAINLGTLSKFLDSYEDEFSALKKYIKNNGILDVHIEQNETFNADSTFHHINFTDYHIYSLTADGAVSATISELLEKVISTSDDNPIYKGYLNYISNFSSSINCPIRYNYEFLFHQKNREVITQLIIKAIVQKKEIVSVRSLLNFIHDIIIPIDLAGIEQNEYENILLNMSEKQFISNILPSYLFEHGELSGLFEKMSYLDPCSQRNANLDDILLKLINSNDPYEIFTEHIKDDFLFPLKSKLNFEKLTVDDLSKFFIRLNYFSNYQNTVYLQDEDFNQYITWLFHFNNNNQVYVQRIFKLVEAAARNWNGDPKTTAQVIINVGKKQTRYRVFKDFKVRAAQGILPKEKTNEILNTFISEFKLFFEINKDDEPIKIDVDFSLFKILTMVTLGYRPNKKDNNNYVYFVNLITKLINKNNDTASLYIDEVNIGKPVDYEFSKEQFTGYTFKLL